MKEKIDTTLASLTNINENDILWDIEIPKLGIYFDQHKKKYFVLKKDQKIVLMSDINTIADARTNAIHQLNDNININKKDNLIDIFLRCKQVVPVDEFYNQIKDLNIVFGKNFKNLKNIWRGDNEAIGLIELNQKIKNQARNYLLHPVLLDSCFQIFGATLYSQDSRKTYLPSGIEELQFKNERIDKIWSYVKLRKSIDLHDINAAADIYFFDQQSNKIGYAKNFSLKLASSLELPKETEENTNQDFYHIAWHQQNVSNALSTLVKKLNWLIITKKNRFSDNLASCLSGLNINHQFFYIDENHTNNFSVIKQQIKKSLTDATLINQTFNAVLINAQDNGNEFKLIPEEIYNQQKLYSSLCVAVTQLLIENNHTNDTLLWLLTQNTQFVEPQDKIMPQHSTMWGLGRTINRELSNIVCKNIDLDEKSSDYLTDILKTEINNTSSEQVAWRNNQRYETKLETLLDSQSFNQDKPYQLRIDEYGALENLKIKTLERKRPSSNEIEIRVCATPINFKDILHALGMLQVNDNQSGVANQSDMVFGGDCAGIVESIGDKVTEFKVGDKVIATMAFGCMASHAVVNRHFVVPMPKNLSYEKASTLTTSYITAHYALNELANIKTGDKVLIHAGTGGLGMAAIHLAKLKGAIVYATAHPSKWHVLEELSVDKIMNSRTLAFADELKKPPFDGVDIVLNSLSGDFILASFNLLKTNGRFIEVGKIGILTPQQAIEKRVDVKYHAFDLMDIAEQDPQYFKNIFSNVMQYFSTHSIPALPCKTFNIENFYQAFNWMSQAKHTGKVILKMNGSNEKNQSIIRNNTSYLISGGLGSIGKKVVQWLVENGAKFIVILTRSNKKVEDVPELLQMQNKDVCIKLITADITSLKQVNHVFETLKKENIPSISNIFHAAGILEDKTIKEQSWQTLDKVFAPKILGAINLHCASLEYDIKQFVMFSSIAGTFGSPGQINYAAANSFLDSFANYRRSLSLPAQSIAWGPWDGDGMAGELDESNRQKIEAIGIKLISSEKGITHLSTLIHENQTNTCVLPINWKTYFSEVPDYPQNFYSIIKQFSVNENAIDYRSELSSMNYSEKTTYILKALSAIVIKVLRINSVENFDVSMGLNELGMDSLMGIELKNKIDKLFDIKLPVTVLTELPNTQQLGQKIITLIIPNNTEMNTTEKNHFNQSSWLVHYPAKEETKFRLFCFHHLGGNAEAFRSWRNKLPSNVDLYAIQLPGRSERSTEIALTSFDSVIKELMPELEQQLNLPYAFFAHSMGTLVAYEAAIYIQNNQLKMPQHLYMAGLWSPHLHGEQKNRVLPSAENLAELEVPQQLLDDEDFRRELQKIATSDEKLLKSYRYQSSKKLKIPITAFGGKDDTIARESDILSWQFCTESNFNHQMFTGKHMFINENKKEIINHIISTETLSK